MIQKIGAVNLKGKVYESLKKYILSLNIYLKESDFHLDERQLSEKLGVSRTPIREAVAKFCLLYTSPSPRDATLSRMPSSA